MVKRTNKDASVTSDTRRSLFHGYSLLATMSNGDLNARQCLVYTVIH